MPRIRPERTKWGLLDAVILGSMAVAACYGFPYLLWPAGIRSAQDYFLRTIVVSMWLFTPTVMWLRAARGVRPVKQWLPVEDLLRDVVVGVQIAMIFAVMNGIGIKLLFERPVGLPRGAAFSAITGSRGAWEITLLILGVGVVTPVAEEVFFRGMLYPAMQRRLGPFVAVIFSAAIFAVAHDPGRRKSAFLLGLIAAIMMEYTGSLVVPILVHMGTNLAFIGFLVRGGQIAEAMPIWLLLLIFAVMNVHLFLAGKLIFGGHHGPSAAPAPSSDRDGGPDETPHRSI